MHVIACEHDQLFVKIMLEIAWC